MTEFAEKMSPDAPKAYNRDLSEFIHREIAQRGPVTVAQFMAWALYHPEFGYYIRNVNIGPRGDFTTSPEASSLFGRLLARHVDEVAELLGSRERFHIIECGPGRGTLALDLLDALREQHSDLYGRTTYWLVEISHSLRNVQRELLAARHSGCCVWVEDLDTIPEPVEGAVIANEFVDAFPVHVLERRNGALLEQYVASAGGNFRFDYAPPSDQRLVSFAEKLRPPLTEGQRVEINLALDEWASALGRKVRRGIAAFVDYGDPAPARYSEARRDGTLLGYYNGAVTADILARPGEQDLTALVDFSALNETLKVNGFTEVALTRQAAFLLGFGLGTQDGTDTDYSGEGIEQVLEKRKGIQALVSMEGLGRFHVAIFCKGIEPESVREQLSGLRFADIL